ncbi:LLM class flavin-dependent oxidoreductase [Streptomyces prasinopilosus]|uniref:LLM class flavin-dependent oxidoreductase n=1 Tax=Streptomyces prasinopilosus TaxID=67344 RepID=UPI000A508954|nr:LLM class flavin-dependent oxidoreductase [Streptomyces prasinopilosus]
MARGSAASTDLPMGVVTAPGQRYPPAVLAQAAATLAERAPGRLWPALGTGQALNEHITGDRRPSEEQRTRRPEEFLRIMRALFAGEEVSHEGLVRVDRAKLRSLPERPPLLLGAAVGPPTARRAAAWADGIITVNRPDDARRETLAAYREGTTFG